MARVAERLGPDVPHPLDWRNVVDRPGKPSPLPPRSALAFLLGLFLPGDLSMSRSRDESRFEDGEAHARSFGTHCIAPRRILGKPSQFDEDAVDLMWALSEFYQCRDRESVPRCCVPR